MLKKQNRLSTNFEFNITRKYGRKAASTYFYFYYLTPKNYHGPSKIGIVISNKLSKKATERNKLKRYFREAIRNNLKIVPEDLWIVIYPKSGSMGKKYEEISTDYNQFISKVFIS